MHSNEAIDAARADERARCLKLAQKHLHGVDYDGSMMLADIASGAAP